MCGHSGWPVMCQHKRTCTQLHHIMLNIAHTEQPAYDRCKSLLTLHQGSSWLFCVGPLFHEVVVWHKCSLQTIQRANSFEMEICQLTYHTTPQVLCVFISQGGLLGIWSSWSKLSALSWPSDNSTPHTRTNKVTLRFCQVVHIKSAHMHTEQ